MSLESRIIALVGAIGADIKGLVSGLSLKANLISPAFTGVPTAPTATGATASTTQIATLAYVQAAKNAETGAAITATVLKTARTISLGGAAISNQAMFDGGSNITISVTGLNVNLVTEGKLAPSFGGTGTTSSTGSGSNVLSGSPALSGIPTVPTAAVGTNTTQIANMAAVRAEIAALVASSPAALDTLAELAAALGDDPNFAASTAAAIGLKADAANTALTGVPTAPTAAAGTNNTQIATMAAVQAAVQGVLTKFVTGGTTTLTAAEASNPLITIAGTLTSNAVIEIPTGIARLYAVSNQTTGAFSVSLKQVGFASLAGVAQGKKNLVYMTGTSASDAMTDFESIVMTGSPLAPTVATSSNGFEVANAAFVKAAIAAGASTLSTYTYDNRADLRSNLTGTHAVVDGLGLFQYAAGSDEPDDDESCFATSAGRWLLQAVHWDVVDAWQTIDESAQDEALEDLEVRVARLEVVILRGSATCTITTMSAGASTAFTGTVAGAAVGDSVLVTPPALLDATAGQGRLSFYAWVSAADTVTVVMTNSSASTATTATAVRVAWPITVFKTGT